HRVPGDGVAVVEGVLESGLRVLRFEGSGDAVEAFRRYGEMPLPPYITSRESTPERYQTVFASEEGSIAAPTAGLHFDPPLLDALRLRGVRIAETVLHVGLGTFKPVEAEEVEGHVMHSERYYISRDLASVHAEVRAEGGTVWACGTTSVRSLESAMGDDGRLRTGWSETACFITPGYRFRAVDHLITNFHLPRSSLLMLVSALCGREKILELYHEAIGRRYRFFSFGDAMAII
ncbi:MAG TPA: S-adenosylmethionine:tRNA ribosyltransferase-isomerase, partial [Candidatus Ozemobacteraceae bacterium]|nr:S-adenosylmethionine:tRNA ribosyltransferase-isomerase [Candidatus Ozemobacteraceae bacterium]